MSCHVMSHLTRKLYHPKAAPAWSAALSWDYSHSAGRGCTVSELAAGQREAACARQIQPQKPTWFRRQGRCRRVPPIRARAAPRQVRGDSRRLYRQRAAGRQQRGADGDSGCRCRHHSTVLLLYRYAVLVVCSDVLAALAATRWSPGCPGHALRGAAGGGARCTRALLRTTTRRDR